MFKTLGRVVFGGVAVAAFLGALVLGGPLGALVFLAAAALVRAAVR